MRFFEENQEVSLGFGGREFPRYKCLKPLRFWKYIPSGMAMENGPVEDVFPIQNGDFLSPCLFTGG